MRFARIAAAVVASVFTASCASATEPAPEPAPATSQPVTNHGAYAMCLAENGVPMPPAGPGAPPGVDEQTWATAQKACADKVTG